MKLIKVGLGLSGGGTKLPFIAGRALRIIKDLPENSNITHISGTSAGAIIAWALMLNKYDDIVYYSNNFNIKHAFKYDPSKRSTKLRAIYNIISGKHNLFNQSTLIDTLKDIVSKEEFTEYKSNESYPIVLVGVVDFEYGNKKYFNLKQLIYEEALNAILASSSISVYTSPVKIRGRWYVDGGLRDHVGSAYLLNRYPDIDKVITIFSRPDFSASHIKGKKQYTLTEPEFGKIVIDKDLLRTIGILNMELSKGDEREANEICIKRNIEHEIHYAPYYLTEEVYDTSIEQNKKLFKLGYNI